MFPLFKNKPFFFLRNFYFTSRTSLNPMKMVVFKNKAFFSFPSPYFKKY